MAIKVRATNPGVHGQYRNPGDEFHIKGDNEFSKKWMEKIDKDGEPVSAADDESDPSPSEGKPADAKVESKSKGKAKKPSSSVI